MNDAIEKIGKVEGSEGSKGAASITSQEDLGPNKAHFDNLMQKAPTEDMSVVQVQDPNKMAVNAPQAPTPMQALADPQKAAKITPPELISQTQEAGTKIKEAKELLSKPDITIKKSAQTELHNRLTHINENIQIALSKAGGEVKDPANAVAAVAPRGNVVEKFLNMLTHGQHQMHALTEELGKMSSTGQSMTPVQMFAMQVKVGNVTAELEFFTATLAKSIESVKTLMNVQV